MTMINTSFDAINESKIKNIYIGSSNKKDDKVEHKEKEAQAENFFPKKTIKFFDYNTLPFAKKTNEQ